MDVKTISDVHKLLIPRVTFVFSSDYLARAPVTKDLSRAGIMFPDSNLNLRHYAHYHFYW
jgi:hypothetical protein